MQRYEKEIIDGILDISGQYSPHQVFSDWVAMSAITMQNCCCLNRDKYWLAREDKYKALTKKYTNAEIQRMCDMLGMLTICMEEEIKDYLGEIYMRSGAGSKQTGQFFTPFHLSVLTAALSMREVDEEHPLLMNEPSTGGGGMILATAKILKGRGINYQRYMKVVAQDLDWNGVYMTYMQLSILGIKAIVVQGDTVSEPYHKKYDKSRVLYTPAAMGEIL